MSAIDTSAHVLRLKIDPAAAQRGAAEFNAAIASITSAVKGLQRDTAGAYTALKKTTSTPAGKGAATSIASINAASRAAEKEVGALTRRLSRMGDARGISVANSALKKFSADLKSSVMTAADLRSVQDTFRGSIFPLQESARQAAELDTLRAAYGRVHAQIDDMGPAQLAYQRGVTATERAHNAGLISATEYRQSLNRLESQYLSTGNAAASAEARNRRYLGSMAGWHGGTGNMRDLARGLSLQISQVGQVASMATSAQQALRGASLQIADIGLLFGTAGAVIGTVATVTLPFLIDRLYAGDDAAGGLSERMETLDGSVSAYQSAARLAGSSTSKLREEFGSLAASVRDSINALREHALVTVQMDLESSARGASKQFDSLFKALTRLDTEDLAGRNLRAVEETARRGLDALNLTTDEARRLRDVLSGLARVEGGPEDMRRAFAVAITTINQLYPSVERMPAPIRELHRALLDGDVAAARLLATQQGVTGESDRAASAASGLSVELGAGADEAARLLANLNGVPAALNAMGGSVRDQIRAIEAQSRSLEIQLDEGLTDAAANRRVQLEQMIAASSTDGRANPGLADQVAGAYAEIEELERAAARQEDLRDRLAEGRRAPRKPRARPSRSGRSGGGAATTDEALRAREALQDRISSTIDSLEAERLALDAVARGMFSTKTAADLYGAALVQQDGLIDAQTSAMLRQIDVAAQLADEMERAARDPVQTWLESVPSWAEGARQIEAEAIGGLRSAIGRLASGDSLDLSRVFGDLAASSAMNVFDQVVGGIYKANGATGSILSRVGGGKDPAAAVGTSMAAGGAQAAAQIHAAMIAGGQQAAMQIGGGIRGSDLALPGSIPAPGAGSGFGGSVLSAGLSFLTAGLFREGGHTTSPVETASLPVSTWAGAPSYAEGTANTSGIPAVLHPNEAVVPLSRGRKIPVDLGGAGSGGPVFAPSVQVTVEGSSGNRAADEEQAQRIGSAVQDRLRAMMQGSFAGECEILR